MCTTLKSIGLCGFGVQEWPSLNRTRRSYDRAISEHFRIIRGDKKGKKFWLRKDLSAVINFSGNGAWLDGNGAPFPRLFAMHGGAVLNQDFLSRFLGTLVTSDVLLTNCRSDVSILEQYFARKKPTITRLSLPVDLEAFKPFGKREARAALNLTRDDFVLGFVGRLVPQRNLHRFLDMLADVGRRVTPRRVAAIVVGQFWTQYPVLDYQTTRYHEFIQKKIKECCLEARIAYYPQVPDDAELAVCYSAMDLLVHPTNSIDENFGYVVPEAFACGTPVIGAAYGGLKDTIEEGITGALMPTWVTNGGIRTDFGRGVAAAISLLTKPRLLAKMSNTCIERARKIYSAEAFSNALRETIESAIANYEVRGQERVIIRDKRDGPFVDRLPKLTRAWNHYRPAVSHYVSRRIPTLTPSTIIATAAPLLGSAEKSGRLSLDDPAWPATYDISDSQQELLKCCQRATSVAALTECGLVKELSELVLLLEEGLIVVCEEGEV